MNLSVSALLREIDNVLGSSLKATHIYNIRNSKKPNQKIYDIFEGYIFSLVLKAARKEGAKIKYENVKRGNPNEFLFRTSPGKLDTGNYSYAKIEFDNVPTLEAHVGVYVQGSSMVKHECDVVVLCHSEAEICRKKGTLPSYNQILFAIECKAYHKTVGIAQGRGFLGLTQDLRTSKKQAFFVTNAKLTSVEKLLLHKKKQCDYNIIPGSLEVNGLLKKFETEFDRFKTRQISVCS